LGNLCVDVLVFVVFDDPKDSYNERTVGTFGIRTDGLSTGLLLGKDEGVNFKLLLGIGVGLIKIFPV